MYIMNKGIPCLFIYKKFLNFNNDIILDQGIEWWSWSYGSWIYSYLCNQCLSPRTLWVPILLMMRCTRYIMWQSLSMTCGRSVRVLRFPPPIKLTTWYNWNFVESGVKHHNPNPFWVKLEAHIHTRSQRGGIQRVCMTLPLKHKDF